MGNKLILASIVAMAMLMGCGEETQVSEPIRPVRVYKIDKQSATESKSFPGKVKAAREVSLAFRVPGQIVSLDVKEGDFVEQDQLICMLDQRDFQAAVADLEARLAGALSVYNESRLNFERNKKLLESDIIAKAAFDAAQSNYATSRANVASLEQEVKRAKLNLQYTKLEAPFSGTIAIKYANNHEYIQAKEPIVQLEDLSSLDIVVDVPETVWARTFKNGKKEMLNFFATFEAFPNRKFPLSLKEYQTKANAGTQTYSVTLKMNLPSDIAIQPGMTAEVSGSMPLSSEKMPVSVPVSSVFGNGDGKKYVWVLDKEGVVHKRQVTVGRIQDDKFSVLTGVSLNETIVECGVNYLVEGQQVKILDKRIGGRG